MAIKFSTEKNPKINNKLQKLTNNILEEKKTKQSQIKRTLKIGKTQGTITRS